jgi:putative hemolysin
MRYRPCSFPETLTGMGWSSSGPLHRILLVVDEYGVVQGLLTPMDMLEAIITGELRTGTTQDAWATRRDDGSAG